jgi:5'/3'-nucleotidase SurE
MDWILVTNDDGPDTPALPPLVRAIERLAPVRTVVPHIERSWVGKAITRFDPIDVENAERDGIEIHIATGYPADCVQLGINTLFDTPPRLVVSGINIGFNHGSAYLQSSGTVGAALEAAISGIDAVAFSTASTTRHWNEWRPWALSPESIPMWERISAVAADLTRTILQASPSRLVLSINLPDDADAQTPRRLTSIADVGYDQLFHRTSQGDYRHDYRGGLRNFASLDGTDIQATSDGLISITPVAAAHTAALPDDLKHALIG